MSSYNNPHHLVPVHIQIQSAERQHFKIMKILKILCRVKEIIKCRIKVQYHKAFFLKIKVKKKSKLKTELFRDIPQNKCIKLHGKQLLEDFLKHEM